MSRQRKRRGKPAGAPPTARTAGEVESNTTTSAPPAGRIRRLAGQLTAVLVASVALGFAFNNSNPVGVRFDQGDATPPAPSVAATDHFLPPPAPAVAAEVNASPAPPSTTPSPVAPPRPKVASLAAPAPPSVPATPPAPNHPHPIPPAVHSTTPAGSITNGLNSPPARPNPTAIHWPEAKALVEAGQAILVDVRHKSLYDSGHIPGAISLPESSSPAEFTAFLDRHPTNLTLIVYCSSISCSQSARVATRFVTQYQRPSVKYMTGGYQEYQQAQLPNPATPSKP